MRPSVGRSLELRRVAALPLRDPDEPLPDLTPLYARSPCTRGSRGDCDLCAGGGPRLLPAQSRALWEAEACRGVFAWVPVGGGKELLSLLLPDALGVERAVICTRPRLKAQLLEVDLPRYSEHFRVPLDRIAGVLSYAELSDPRRDDVLERLNPDLIVANEGHAFRHPSSMRTKRLKRWLDEHPRTLFCPLSGTMCTDSILDYNHLLEWSLRGGAPLPRSWREVQDWSRALDDAPDRDRLAPGALLTLMGEGVVDELMTEDERVLVAFGQLRAEEILRAKAREVYRRRLVSTPGVVVTGGEDGCRASLVVQRRDVEVPPVVERHLDQLHRLWRVGEREIDEAAQVQAAARQLACGFYYRWDWPDGVPDEEWLEAKSAWARAVRRCMRWPGKLRLDSPSQVARAVERGDLDCPEWAAWDAVRSRPAPPVVPVWLSDFLIRDVIRWCSERTEGDRGIAWFYSGAVEDALRAAGLEVYAAGQDEVVRATSPAICASLSYREGLNVQDRYSCGLVVEPPANGTAWEQLLGRFHRPGQRADEVTLDVYQHDRSLRSAVSSALADARLNRANHSQRPKLLLAQRIGMGGGGIEGEGETWPDQG